MTGWVAMVVLAVVNPVSGHIDRTDQRAFAPDLLLRRTADGLNRRIYVLDCGMTVTSETSNRVTQLYTVPGVGSGSNDHGTRMASVAAGVTYGLAPAAQIFNVKVCESSTSVYPENVISGLDFLASQQVGIVNISQELRLSVGNPYIAQMQSKIQTLRSLGFVVVAAAGNTVGGNGQYINDGSFVSVPAGIAESVAVAGMTYNPDVRLPISNYGPEVDLFAAGELQAMDDTGNFQLNAGSSGSAALVSGAFAAAADYGGTQTGSSLESFVLNNAIWDSVANGNSPNAARLFSDLGTVGQTGWTAPTPTVALFCGSLFVSTTRTVALAAGANGDIYLAFETRCPSSTSVVDFYVQKRNSAGVVLWTQRFADPNGTNSNSGEAIGALAVNPTTQRVALDSRRARCAHRSTQRSVRWGGWTQIFSN